MEYGIWSIEYVVRTVGYGIGNRRLGGVVQPGNRFVSCRACVRACVRARGLVALVIFQRNRSSATFPFPFVHGILSLVPCEIMCSLWRFL